MAFEVTGNPVVDMVADIAARYLLKTLGVDAPSPELIEEAKEPGLLMVKAGVESYDLYQKVKTFKAAGGV
jgi:hypothetical protein